MSENSPVGCGEAAAPILVSTRLPVSQVKYKAIKCKCLKSWCPSCSKLTVIKPMVEHFEPWDWRCVRLITLTINRNLFEGPEQAFDAIQKHKAIPNLMHNLNRTAGAGIVDWVRVLEWHKDGFPHWHLLVLVDKPGFNGQLGGDSLRKYWRFGAVRETYVKSAKHWKRFTGYFAKQGYFEDKKGKKHQVELPEWAKQRKTALRRWGKKRNGILAEEGELVHVSNKTPWEEKPVDEQIDELGNWFDMMATKAGLTEGEKLALCGCMTEVYRGPDWSDFVGVLDCPYAKFVSEVNGVFVKGQGFVFEVDPNLDPSFFKIYGLR